MKRAAVWQRDDGIWVSEACAAEEYRENWPLPLRVPIEWESATYLTHTEALDAALTAVGLAPEKEK